MRAVHTALVCVLAVLLSGIALAQPPPYRPADPRLKLVLIDSDPTESFLAVHLDTAGRLFVGGRQRLFVYEPDGRGGFGRRQLLASFPNHTWIYDIAVRGNDLYLSTVSAIYLIRDAVARRQDLNVERLVWGIPLGHVHQCIHNMDWGPEGDLYFSTGDPLWNYGDFQNRPDHWGHWTWIVQPNETKVEYNGVGGVFRIHPDGSGFRVVARGLRNSVGLSFDSRWNLFTNDNDHEQLPANYVPGRLLHVVPHAYFSWPRGWMPSKQPHRPDLLETMNDHLGRYVPVGTVDYEDSLLPDTYRHSLILDRWGEHKLVYYPIEPRGASFKAQEHDLVQVGGDARPVGVAVGGGGRVFVTVCYMPANDSSPTYRSDLLAIEPAAQAPAAAHQQRDMTAESLEDLYRELSCSDWSRRHAAHEEVLRRGQSALAIAAQRLLAEPTRGPAEHLIWLAAASRRPNVQATLAQLARSAAPPVRLQALRALDEFSQASSDVDVYVQAVKDRDPAIQLVALDALVDHLKPAQGQKGENVPQEVAEACRLEGDSYVRQAAATVLALKGPLSQLESLLGSPDSGRRLTGILATGFRLTVPAPTGPAPKGLKLDDKAHAYSYVIPNFYDSPPVDLRKLGRIGDFTVAQQWADVKHTADQDRLFVSVAQRLDDPNPQNRFEAAFFLNLLNDPRTAQRIGQVLAEFRPKSPGPRRAVDELWALGPFPDDGRIFEIVHPPEQGPIDLTARYPAGKQTITWKRISDPAGALHLDKLLAVRRGIDSSWYAYFRMESARTQPGVLLVGSQQQVRIWQNGRQVWDNWAGRPFKADEDRVELTLQTGSNDILVRVHSGSSVALRVAYEAADPVHVTLPDPLDTQRLAQRLAEAKDAREVTDIPPQFARIDWASQWKGGDRDRGRRLFDSLGCGKCHAVSSDSSGGGAPSLADAAKRFTVPYVVESILLPNRVVSPLFRWTVVQTADGQVYNGLVIGETADALDMRMPDTTLKTIRKSQIKLRRQEDRSPMPQGLVRTPDELRDLLAFLMSSDH